MDFNSIIEQMDALTCASLRHALEIGKFPGGRRLSDEQKATCLEAVLRWEFSNCNPEDRTGYIDRGAKKDGARCAEDAHDEKRHDDQPLRFIDRP